MLSTKNPFPGMNPFLEMRGPDVHVALIGYIRDGLSSELPLDLNVRAEEGITIAGPEKPVNYRADVAVSESWKRGIPPAWQPAEKLPDGVALAEPIVLHVPPETPRWLEIREAGGRLITVIEVLSATNKIGDGANDYRSKRRDYQSAGVNVVEIDLLRGGEHVLGFPRQNLRGAAAAAPYMICVSREASPGTRFVYPIALAQRLPAIAIPLRERDADVPLDLQPLLDRAYENGRHWQEDFSQPLHPPLNAEEQAWVTGQLRAAELVP